MTSFFLKMLLPSLPPTTSPTPWPRNALHLFVHLLGASALSPVQLLPSSEGSLPVSTSILPRAEWTPVPHKWMGSRWSLSAQSLVSGLPGLRYELHGEGFLFHLAPSKPLFGSIFSQERLKNGHQEQPGMDQPVTGV